jgi:hypothetical protein
VSGDLGPVEPLTAPPTPVDPWAWVELLHDWRTVSEHDGGYALLRCQVCGTEVVR